MTSDTILGMNSLETDVFELPHSEASNDSPRRCIECSAPLRGRQRKLCSSKCRGRYYGRRTREKNHAEYLEYHRKYREDHKEWIKKKDRLRYERNREKRLERQRLYCQQNKERVREANRKYYQRNKEKVYKKHLEYINSPSGRTVKNNMDYRRRAIKKKIIETFDREEAQRLIDSCNGICPSCNQNAEITIDHILPISKAPDWHIYTLDDVQPLCRSCNSSKGNSQVT